MNAKSIVITVAIALLSSTLAIVIHSKINPVETRIVEVPVETNNVGRDISLTSLAPVTGPDLTFAAEKSVNAVVHVRTKARATTPQVHPGHPFFEFFFGPGFSPGGTTPHLNQPQPVMGSGSGVILSSDGFIVTNNHVIDRAEEIEIILNDRRTFNAVKVGADPTTDIALLKIDASGLPYLRYGNSDNLRIGEWVLAVGNPFNLTSTVTAGIVSAKSRSIQILGQMSIEAFIQTDAAVNPGNSGGALVNINGELVGINTAIASRTGSFAGYSFAVPVSIVEKVVGDLKEFGKVQRGLMGVNIREMTSELAEQAGLDEVRGVYVAEVIENGGAKDAGIKSGDIITSINGTPVNSVPQLQERVSRFRPGDNLRVEVIREKRNRTFTVTLRNIHGNTEIVQRSTRLDILGATFEPLSESERQRLRLRNGLKVTALTAGKFRDAGIGEGYIITQANRVPINSEEDLSRVIEVLEGGLFLSGVYTNGSVAYYAINLRE